MIERIHFGVPQLRQLKKEGFFCADMHFHSRYSDTFTRPKSIIKLADKRGVGVAITDHNNIKACADARKEARERNVPLINGMEISSKEGPHLLAYFYSLKDMTEFYEKHVKDNKDKNPYMALKLSSLEIARRAKDYNAIVSAAHPRATPRWDFMKKIKKGKISRGIMKHLDCAEVICGLILRRLNVRAVEWAFEEKLGITGGSDGHTLYKLGSVVTYSRADDVNSFLDSIIKKKNYVAGRETKMLPRAISYSKALTKHSRYIGPSVRIHSGTALRNGFNNIRDRISSRKNSIKKQ